MSNKNLLTEAQNKYWYSYAQYNVYLQAEQNQERTSINEAFAAGAKWSIKQTSELSPHIAKFIEMMVLLGYLEWDQ